MSEAGSGGTPKAETLPAVVDDPEQSESTLLRQELETELKSLSVPPEKRENVIQRVLTLVESYRGPLPHPRHFGQFEEILPGSAERILRMAENEQSYRHGMGRNIVRAESSYASKGQLIGAFVIIALIGCALYSIILGSTTGAGLFLGAGALGGVAMFVNGQIRWGGRVYDDAEDEEEPRTPPPQKKKPKKGGKRR